MWICIYPTNKITIHSHTVNKLVPTNHLKISKSCTTLRRATHPMRGSSCEQNGIQTRPRIKKATILEMWDDTDPEELKENETTVHLISDHKLTRLSQLSQHSKMTLTSAFSLLYINTTPRTLNISLTITAIRIMSPKHPSVTSLVLSPQTKHMKYNTV